MDSRLSNTEDCINDLEGSIMEITQSEQQKEKQILKIERNLRDIWDNIKCTNIPIIGSQMEKRNRRGSKMYLRKLWLKISQT